MKIHIPPHFSSKHSIPPKKSVCEGALHANGGHKTGLITSSRNDTNIAEEPCFIHAFLAGATFAYIEIQNCSVLVVLFLGPFNELFSEDLAQNIYPFDQRHDMPDYVCA